MKLKLNKLIPLALGGALTALSAGNDISILQKDKQFSTTAVTAKVGDRLVIKNADEFNHNLISLTPGTNFGSHMERPGEAMTYPLTAPGEFDIQCLIHPKMKMHVVVAKP